MPLGKIQTQIVAKLQEMELITAEQCEAIGAVPGEPTGDVLDKMLQDDYRLSPFQILVAKGRALGLAPFNLGRYRVNNGTYEHLPLEFCKDNLVMPVGQVGNFLLVAFANPFEVTVPNKIAEMTGMRVIRLLCREKDLREKFTRDRSQGDAQFAEVVKEIGQEFGQEGAELSIEDVTEESGPIIQLSNRIIEDAYYANASDIHVEPWEKEVIIRYRIDGICQEKLRLPAKVAPALVARLKIMCDLNIAERRLPQDGRIIFKHFSKKGVD
ncbi:MAG: ATPase, T2SS/T4P/T4SS family, partial [Opitutaceae bacterium]